MYPGRQVMRAVVVQETLRRYRVPFFEALRERLNHDGIELEVHAGQPTESELAKQDLAELAWARRVTNRRMRVGSRNLVWQSSLRALRGADLVIVEQASRMLLNYVLLAWRPVGGPSVAFWGHGRNLASSEGSRLGEMVKRVASRHVDWWFAYNDLSASIVEQMGFPKRRITSVMNAKDTTQLAAWRRRCTQDDIDNAAAAVGLQGKNVGVFVGSLYRGKHLDLLLAAAQRVRDAVPDFELLVIGAGSEAGLVQSAARSRPWIRYAGPRAGVELAQLVSASKAMLVPAGLGLVAVDAFALQAPIVTCAGLGHGPEVDYLEHGENAWLVPLVPSPDRAAAYADAVIRLLTDDALRNHLVDGCRRSAEVYTLSNMVARFAAGVRGALGA